MGFLHTLVKGYARQASGHTGMHYAPSFNDLNSGVADDAEEIEHNEHFETIGHAMHRDVDDGHIQQDNMKAAKAKSMIHNKTDPNWPQFGTSPIFGDLHKVNRAYHPRSSSHMYDIPRGADGKALADPSQAPSVWDLYGQKTDTGGYKTSQPTAPAGYGHIMADSMGTAGARSMSARSSLSRDEGSDAGYQSLLEVGVSG